MSSGRKRIESAERVVDAKDVLGQRRPVERRIEGQSRVAGPEGRRGRFTVSAPSGAHEAAGASAPADVAQKALVPGDDHVGGPDARGVMPSSSNSRGRSSGRARSAAMYALMPST